MYSRSFISPKQGNIKEEDIITATIQQHEIKQEETFPYSNYVMYKVDLNSSIKNWSVYKRYNNFKELHQQLSKHVHKINLPTFPERKFFNLNSQTINDRKEKLETYLNFFLEKKKLVNYSEILNFIEIDKDTLKIIVNNFTLHENNSNTYKKSFLNKSDTNLFQKSKSQDYSGTNHNEENYFIQFLEYKTGDCTSKSAYMLVIEEFLNNLESKFQNKTNIIKTFENFLKAKKHWPNLKTDEISRLFFGENDQYNKIFNKGLLEHIGSVNQNPLGSEECLFFLSKLLNFEFNPDCERYINVLRSAKTEMLMLINFDVHMRNIKTKVKVAIYNILKAIYDEKTSVKIQKVLNEEQYKDFANWLSKEFIV